MRKSLLACLLVLEMTFACSTQQFQNTEKDLTNVLQISVDTLDTLAEKPEIVTEAEAALSLLAAVGPQTGPIHQAIIDAQAALNSLQKHTSSIGEARAALQLVVTLLEHHGSIPLGAIKHGIAPVGSK